MAFDLTGLTKVGGRDLFLYDTTDDVSTVLASGYFNGAFQTIKENSIIDANCNNNLIQLRVASNTGGVVATKVASKDTSTSVIYIREASDFGDSIDSSKIYFIDTVVDMGSTSIEVPSTGISLLGHSFDTSKLISSANNYTMFTSPAGGSGNVLGAEYAIEVTGTNSKVYDITDATGFNAFEFTRINYNDCTSLGEISGYRQGLETGTGRFGGKPELTLSGTWVGGYFIDTSIVRSLTDGAYSLFKAGTGFSMASRFRSNQNIDLPASASFIDFAPSNFPNPSTVQLDGCLISRNGSFNAEDSNIIPNLNASDLASKWTENVGIENTFEGGRLTITSETATVVSATNTFYDLAGTWTAAELEHFDSPSSGQLRHVGINPREYNIVCDMVIDSGSNNELAIKAVKWDNSASAFVDIQTQVRQINALVGARDVAFFTMIARVELDQNDYIKFQAENRSSTSNITVENDSYFVVEPRK